MASCVLSILVALAGVLPIFSFSSPVAVLLGGQYSDSLLKGPLPSVFTHLNVEQQPVVETNTERCGPPLGSSGAFFGCGFLSGIVVTVLTVGALSERNVTSKKSSGASDERDSRLVARDPEPEPASTNPTSSSLHSDNWLQGQRSQDTQEVFDNIQEFWPRCTCLALLLFVQSGSSLILASFQQLVSEHTSLVYFFTMLVGLGGNAGVQSVVLAVRRFAINEEVSVSEQFYMGVKLAAVLAPLAFLRCRMQGTSMDVCLTVGLASIIITILATSLGTSLALLLQKFRVDPAHASPTIQVIMDMIGLLIACTMGWIIMTFLAI